MKLQDVLTIVTASAACWFVYSNYKTLYDRDDVRYVKTIGIAEHAAEKAAEKAVDIAIDETIQDAVGIAVEDAVVDTIDDTVDVAVKLKTLDTFTGTDIELLLKTLRIKNGVWCLDTTNISVTKNYSEREEWLTVFGGILLSKQYSCDDSATKRLQ